MKTGQVYCQEKLNPIAGTGDLEVDSVLYVVKDGGFVRVVLVSTTVDSAMYLQDKPRSLAPKDDKLLDIKDARLLWKSIAEHGYNPIAPEKSIFKQHLFAYTNTVGPTSTSPWHRRVEYKNAAENSDKFYEVTVDSSGKVTIRYGRIGKVGQSSTHQEQTYALGIAFAERKISEKLAKGYVYQDQNSA